MEVKLYNYFSSNSQSNNYKIISCDRTKNQTAGHTQIYYRNSNKKESTKLYKEIKKFLDIWIDHDNFDNPGPCREYKDNANICIVLGTTTASSLEKKHKRKFSRYKNKKYTNTRHLS